MNKSRKFSAGRRKFLKGAAVAGAATLAVPTGVAQNQLAQPQRATAAPLTAPGAEAGTPPEVDVLTADRCGSDFMVDIIKSLDIEYFCSNPGSSFRALHESVINYGSNTKPEFITCCHEESSVGMAHGYAKIEGKPLGVLAHGTVGLQHASMAIFNAYCDRVPMYIIVGNTIDATMRRPGVEWVHSVQDAAAMVRDYIKWDDLPISLQHFAESAVRAYKITMTPPMGPVLLVADSELQERPIEASDKLRQLRPTKSAPPQGDSGAVAEAARYLVAAENPVIIADRAARTQAGVKYLIELAEALQAPVIDQGGRMNFPSQHLLNHSDRGRAAIAEAVRRLITADRRNAFQARATKLANARQAVTERVRADATYGWDASPISTARMSAELWAQIKNEDWSLVSPTLGGWPQRFWTIDKHYQFIGGPGAYGVGYCAPAATGAALANKKYGRLSVNFQPDGDLMYAPGVLWTAAHHRIPLLSIMHNNRAYHQEVMHLQWMSNRHQRGIERAGIGTTLQDPDINYAQLAKSMGLYAEGPIGDPKDLGPAIKRAIAAVKRGEPALLDVVTQPR